MVAAGAAAHSDHGRDLVETLLAIGEGATTDYAIRDEAKLRRLAEEVGLDVAGKDTKAVALALAEQFYEDFGSRRGTVSFLGRVPAKRREVWAKLGITPRGIDRDVVEMMHRTHMGAPWPVNRLSHSRSARTRWLAMARMEPKLTALWAANCSGSSFSISAYRRALAQRL